MSYNEEKDFKKLAQIADRYLSLKAKQNDVIYKFMDHYSIGKNEYGKLMDAAANGKHIMTHRLYGHHLVFDFPADLSDQINFLKHEISDLFTKQGLPIIPGELLEKTNSLKMFDKLEKNWNFVNGFDILSGTLSIYNGLISFKKAIEGDLYGENIETLAKTLGIGAIDLAIACSTCNPFLLIGAVIHISSGIISIKNDSLESLVALLNEDYSLKFVINNASINEVIEKSKIQIVPVEDYTESKTIHNFISNTIKRSKKC